MKKRKTQSADKPSKKDEKKAARKALETSLIIKLKQVIQGLGYETKSIEKDIEKVGKLLSRKLSAKKVKISAVKPALNIKSNDLGIEKAKTPQKNVNNKTATKTTQVVNKAQTVASLARKKVAETPENKTTTKRTMSSRASTRPNSAK